jgi:hypothetical protein
MLMGKDAYAPLSTMKLSERGGQAMRFLESITNALERGGYAYIAGKWQRVCRISRTTLHVMTDMAEKALRTIKISQITLCTIIG